eukprot:gene20646-27434_t
MQWSGACMAIGLKYAGSANAQAHEVLRHYTLLLLATKRKCPEAPTGVTDLAAVNCLDKAPLEACLDVVVLALSLVMGGPRSQEMNPKKPSSLPFSEHPRNLCTGGRAAFR